MNMINGSSASVVSPSQSSVVVGNPNGTIGTGVGTGVGTGGNGAGKDPAPWLLVFGLMCTLLFSS